MSAVGAYNGLTEPDGRQTKILGIFRVCGALAGPGFSLKGGENMTVTTKPLNASFRVTNLQDETIQIYQRFRPEILLSQAEMILEAVGMIRGVPVGNGFLTVTNELAEA
jgi:hypothetical protein